MADNKPIKNYTAADIEKYWNHQLSTAEMHAMEKAAMDDPFLADALEGYKNSKNIPGEILSLRDKFEIKLKAAAPLISLNRKRFGWLRVAAAIVIIAGGGLLVQQLFFNNGTQQSIADNSKEPTKVTATNKDAAGNKLADTLKNETAATEIPVVTKSQKDPAVKENAAASVTATDTLLISKSPEKVYKAAEGEVLKEAMDEIVTLDTKKEKSEEKSDVVTAPQARAFLNKNDDKENARTKQPLAQNAGMTSLNNRYNYRVVDAQDNPIPFANVTNTRDNVGTYTDIKGNFNLVSSDSVLDVKVRSLGYDAANYRLFPSAKTNTLVLKEDATARLQMENIQGRKLVSNVARNDSAAVIEPEVGWGYYNTYVENNLKIPDNLRAKNSLSEVELSFDVDKSGNPVNIKVTKSSQCKECDEEAIRLLKEGPKWKKRGKKSKTTISISVDK